MTHCVILYSIKSRSQSTYKWHKRQVRCSVQNWDYRITRSSFLLRFHTWLGIPIAHFFLATTSVWRARWGIFFLSTFSCFQCLQIQCAGFGVLADATFSAVVDLCTCAVSKVCALVILANKYLQGTAWGLQSACAQPCTVADTLEIRHNSDLLILLNRATDI